MSVSQSNGLQVGQQQRDMEYGATTTTGSQTFSYLKSDSQILNGNSEASTCFAGDNKKRNVAVTVGVIVAIVVVVVIVIVIAIAAVVGCVACGGGETQNGDGNSPSPSPSPNSPTPPTPSPSPSPPSPSPSDNSFPPTVQNAKCKAKLSSGSCCVCIDEELCNPEGFGSLDSQACCGKFTGNRSAICKGQDDTQW